MSPLELDLGTALQARLATVILTLATQLATSQVLHMVTMLT